MTLSKPEQFYMTNKFEDVTYDLTSPDPCVPISGTITTAVFKSPTDKDALKTYRTVFSNSLATVDGDAAASGHVNSSISHQCGLNIGH